MNRLFPILDWLPNYSMREFKGDLPAGLTVGIMLVPQGMAYALIAGLPPVYGLYAALIPQVVYAVFGTSRQLAVGPVAMDSLLVASGLIALAAAGSERYIQLAILLALMMGAIQLVLGLAKMGFLVNFLSRPVISGFTSAAAFIIGFNQLTHVIGADIPRSNQVHLLAVGAIEALGELNTVTLGIGLGAMGALFFFKRFVKGFPAALLVVVVGILIVRFGGLEAQGVAIVGNVPAGLPGVDLPTISKDDILHLLPVAATLALIAFMEAISVAKAMEERHPEHPVSANQELRALGLANVIGSFFMCYPTTGGFSRTAVNDQAGAKTGMAAIISAGVVMLVLLMLTPLFYHLPKAVLGAIILVAVSGLVDFSYPRQLWKTQRDEFILLIITFVVTAGIGITQGIVTGAVLALFMMVYRTARPHIAELGRINSFYKNIQRFPEAAVREDVLAIRWDGQLYYANKDYFKSSLSTRVAEKGTALRLVVLNAESMNYVDASGGLALLQFVQNLQENGIAFHLAGAIGPVRDKLKVMGLNELIGEDYYFVRTSEAIDAFDAQTVSSTRSIAAQSSRE